MPKIYATDAGDTLNVVPSNLYWINPVNAVATLVGSIGFDDVRSLAYDFDTDVLWGISAKGTGLHQIITINTTTGAGTLVSTVTTAMFSIQGSLIIVDGKLYVWEERNSPQDFITIIDRPTGNWWNVGPSGLSSDRDALGYNPVTKRAYIKAGNLIGQANLSTGSVDFSNTLSINAGVSCFQGFTFAADGTAYASAFPSAGASKNMLLRLDKPLPIPTGTVIITGAAIEMGVAFVAGRHIVALTWVPDPYVAPTVKPIPVVTPAAPQTPCTPKSELSNGGKGKFGCNNGGLGRSTIYSGPFGSAPSHADPLEGEDLDGKEFAGIEVWVRLYMESDPSGAVSVLQRAMTDLADQPSYEGGRKPGGLLSVGDIEHSIGSDQNGLGVGGGSVSFKFADKDRSFRDWLGTQDLEGDELEVLMASDLARGAV